MLIIDNKELKVIKNNIGISNFINNGVDGYNINISLEFENNDRNGYLNLSAGFEKDANITNFTNREYIGILFNKDNQYIDFEVFDTEKFLDTEIDNEIVLQIKDIIDNKIMVCFEVNHKLINIKFEGLLNIL